MIETQLPDALEIAIQRLHGCLQELVGLQNAGRVWVDARVLAAELERILKRNERRPGEGPGPAQNKDTTFIVPERGERRNGKNSTCYDR